MKGIINMSDCLYLYLDESGNLGSGGRYFTIAAVETVNPKPLGNIMKKTILKTKTKFERFQDVKEIKASESNQIIKDFFLRRIASKENIQIRYIVSDKKHVKKELLDDENLLYNFMLKLLIVPVAKMQGLKRLIIILDKRSIKVKSANSFEDYINIILRFELNLDIEIVVEYLESQNSYAIQAADFIANAIYTKYEFENEYFYKLFDQKISFHNLFPPSNFGKPYSE